MYLCVCVFAIEEQPPNPPQLVICSFPMSSPHPLVEGVVGDCHSSNVGTPNSVPWTGCHHGNTTLACQRQSSSEVLHTCTCPRVHTPKPAHVRTQASQSSLPSDCLEVCQLLLVQSKMYMEMTDLTNGRAESHWAICYHTEDVLSWYVSVHAWCVCTCMSLYVCTCVCCVWRGGGGV